MIVVLDKLVYICACFYYDSAAKAAMLQGSTFYFKEGTYDFKKVVSLNFADGAKIAFTFNGGYTGSDDTRGSTPTIFSGNSEHQIFDIIRNVDLTVNYCNFENGKATDVNGGAVIMNTNSNSSFTADNCVFSNNSTNKQGGVFYQTSNTGGDSRAQFTNCTFLNNSASQNGGVAQIYKGTAEFGKGNTFTNNSATDGGVFFLKGTADISVLRITGGTFGGSSLDEANNAAGANGGGVIYKEGGTLSVSNATFKYNKATTNGGVFSVKNETGSATFTSCTFSYNKATVNGGVIYSTDGGVTTLNNCKADHNSAVTGGVAQVYKGTLTIDGSDSDYRQNTASSDGGFAYLNHADAKLNIGLNTTDGTIKLFQNTATYGGAISQETGASVVTIANAVFDANKASNKAGAIFVSVGNWTISNSQFLNNQSDESGSKTAADTKDDGMGGAMVVKGAGTVSIDGCYFENNISGKKDNTDSKSYGGAVVINNGTVNCTGSEFNANKGNRGAVLFMVSGGGGKFTADRCSFHGNKYWSRGVLYVQTKNLVFLNRCSFYDNAPRAVTSDCYGTSIHGAGSTAICLNNCTVNNTEQQAYTKNIQVLNTDGSMLLTNNTIIGYVRNGAVRTGATATYLSSVGNVIINTNSGQASYNVKSTTGFHEGYNLLGATNSMNETPGISASSKTGVAASNFTWVTDWYTWNGPSSLSFTAPTKAQVTAAYNNFAVDASGWGGCLTSITNVGSTFKSWLESLNPVGYNVNQHGEARSGSYWPGSYQN